MNICANWALFPEPVTYRCSSSWKLHQYSPNGNLSTNVLSSHLKTIILQQYHTIQKLAQRPRFILSKRTCPLESTSHSLYTRTCEILNVAGCSTALDYCSILLYCSSALSVLLHFLHAPIQIYKTKLDYISQRLERERGSGGGVPRLKITQPWTKY